MPMSEINVTPFVDVMLVLLIIFMVAAPLLTAGVPLELPQATGKPLEAQQNEPLVVSVTRDGSVYLGQEDRTAVALDALGQKLQAISKSRGGQDEPIFVRGDKATEYGAIARVMAKIKESGFRKLSLVTEVEGGG
jgi:biopolymer transport protein TolR